MDFRSRYDDLHEAVSALIEAKLAEVHTAMPFKVVSVDWSKKPPTLVAQPTIKARVRKPDGTQEWMDLPQVPDVPINFPSGGGVTMTFPVKEGDEGMLHFSSRSIDAYQQQGGEQQQVDIRPHDLSNAYASVGVKTSESALDSVSSDSTQIRSDDGTKVIDIHPANGLTMTSGGTILALSDAGIDATCGYFKCNGKRIDETHEHTNTQPGGGLSGPPA